MRLWHVPHDARPLAAMTADAAPTPVHHKLTWPTLAQPRAEYLYLEAALLEELVRGEGQAVADSLRGGSGSSHRILNEATRSEAWGEHHHSEAANFSLRRFIRCVAEYIALGMKLRAVRSATIGIGRYEQPSVEDSTRFGMALRVDGYDARLGGG